MLLFMWSMAADMKILRHTGFSTKELHAQNLRAHPIRPKGAFASMWINYLLIAG